MNLLLEEVRFCRDQMRRASAPYARRAWFEHGLRMLQLARAVRDAIRRKGR